MQITNHCYLQSGCDDQRLDCCSGSRRSSASKRTTRRVRTASGISSPCAQRMILRLRCRLSTDSDLNTILRSTSLFMSLPNVSICLVRHNLKPRPSRVQWNRLIHRAENAEANFASASHELADAKTRLECEVSSHRHTIDLPPAHTLTASVVSAPPRLAATPSKAERNSSDIERIRALEIENESLGMQLLACDEERLTSLWQIEDLKRNLSALYADLALVTSATSASFGLDNLVARINVDATRVSQSSPSLCDELADVSLSKSDSAVTFPAGRSAASSCADTGTIHSDFTEPLSVGTICAALEPDLDSSANPASVVLSTKNRTDAASTAETTSPLVAENQRLRAECAMLAEQLHRLQHTSTAQTAAQKIALAALTRLQLRQDSYRSNTAPASGVPGPERAAQTVTHGVLQVASEADARHSDSYDILALDSMRNSNNISSYSVATASTVRRQMPGAPVSGSRMPPAPTSSPNYTRGIRKSSTPHSVASTGDPLYPVHRSSLFASDESSAVAAPSTPLPIQSLLRVGPLSTIKALSAHHAASDPTSALIDSISNMCNQ
jgi:hypothetical protein